MTTSERRAANPPAPQAHTPGPWAIEPDEASECRGLVVVSPHNGIVCLLDSDSTDEGHVADGEVWADARLIAAAPDLLAACELMQAALTEHKLRDVKKRFSLCAADAAISKAISKAKGGA